MSDLLAPYPDAELVTMDLLRGFVTDDRIVTATDAKFVGRVIQVERIGGPDDGVTDRARIKITVYDDTRPLAWEVTRAIQTLVLAAGGRMVTGPNTAAEYPNGVLIDRTVTSTPPKQVPESGRGSRQIETVYEIHLRRPWW